MNENLVELVNAISIHGYIIADSFVLLAETLVQEVVVKNQMLVWIHSISMILFLILGVGGIISLTKGLKKFDDSYELKDINIGTTYIVGGALGLIAAITGTITNGVSAVECAANAAAPTLTLLESVLR